MVLESLVGAAIGYLANAAKKSEGGKKASDEMTAAIWEWIGPIFLKDDKKAGELKKLEEQPDDEENKKAASQTLKNYLEQHPEKATQLKALMDDAKAKYPERMGDVYNLGNVEKQVNNPIIKGDLNM